MFGALNIDNVLLSAISIIKDLITACPDAHFIRNDGITA